jgi:hypothetical protein
LSNELTFFSKKGIIYEVIDPAGNDHYIGRLFWLPEVEQELRNLLRMVANTHKIDTELTTTMVNSRRDTKGKHPNHKSWAMNHEAAIPLFFLLGELPKGIEIGKPISTT